jgi:polyisoprenoid-binding protein YceI
MKKLIGIIIGLSLVGSSLVFADTFQVDASHSDVGFSVKHLGVSKTRGQFQDVSGTIVWNGKKELKTASIEGSVSVKSLDTQNEKRDGHLLSADFFDAEQYPAMTFKSKRIYKKLGKLYAKGDLTIHGVTHEVRLPISILGPVSDPWGNVKIGFEGELKIDRKDYGLTWNKTLDQGGLLIGDTVQISLNIEGLRVSQ